MNTMQAETTRIAGELRKAVRGPAWHGPALLELLADVDARAATARPVADAHSIQEIVLHLATWLQVVHERLDGQHREVRDDEDWPPAGDGSDEGWRRLLTRVDAAAERLAARIEQFPDQGLDARLPGAAASAPTAYANLHGSVQHVLYHAGQVAVLKKGSRP